MLAHIRLVRISSWMVDIPVFSMASAGIARLSCALCCSECEGVIVTPLPIDLFVAAGYLLQFSTCTVPNYWSVLQVIFN